jgi:Protein of unknown function (DUF3810)
MVSVAIVGTALVAAMAPMRAEWIERLFSNGVYALIQPRLTRLSNLSPVALFDMSIVGLAILMLVWLARACMSLRTRGWPFAARSVTLVAALYLIFLSVWGLNYRREPLRRTLEFHQERVTRDALRDLAARAVSELNLIHPMLSQAWPAWSDLPPRLGAAVDATRAAIGPRWRVELGSPKRSLLNPYFRRTAIDGMIGPFFLEVLVNQDVLPFERPFIAAHEWAHLAGRADEGEANFVGWMTCMHGPLWARYSGWISLYGTIVTGLSRDDRQAIGGMLEAGPRQDLVALSERVTRQSSPLARRASSAAYDRFLKANRLREGVTSYGLVVTLLLGTTIDVPPLSQ